MSRILFINSVCNGSTGTICKQLYDEAEKKGHVCCLAYGRGDEPNGFRTIQIGNQLDIYLHVLKSRLFDASGFGSKHATQEFIRKVKEFNPDVIHLHNIHGYYINVEVLFKFLKEQPKIKKVWTLHDCWSFTGHCSHYLFNSCNKWCTNCTKCNYKNEYPKAYVDRSCANFEEKNSLFIDIHNLIIVTPSKWLAIDVKKSFLKKYQIEIINNGIDTNIFSYRESNLRDSYGLNNKTIILGVAFHWTKRKGFIDFLNLSNIIDDNHHIVLIGLTAQQIKKLPENITGIMKTGSKEELAKWYSAADVFFNPTQEDNFPTTNLEARACGCYVVTYDVGGCSETVSSEDTIVKTLDEAIPSLLSKRERRINKTITKVNLNLDKTVTCKNYIKLYEV